MTAPTTDYETWEVEATLLLNLAADMLQGDAELITELVQELGPAWCGQAASGIKALRATEAMLREFLVRNEA